jgi:AraC-like DNA-binding protein
MTDDLTAMTRAATPKPTWLSSLHMSVLIVAYLRDQGIGAEQLLEGSGITTADLEGLQRLIAPSQEQEVFANAARLAQRPALGLELGQRARITMYGLAGYAMLSAPTLNEALAIATSFPELVGSYFEVQVECAGSQAWLRPGGYREQAELLPFNTEVCLSALKVLCSDLLGLHVPVLELQLQYPEPPSSAVFYQQAFGCRTTFNCKHSGFAISASWLDKPLPLANPVTHKEMLEHCQRRNAEIAASRAWLEKVRALIAERMDMPPSMEELARAMNCSVSSLRRRLAKHQTSYQQLLDDLRFGRAKELLQGDLPLYRIAEELGFSETAALRHAFQRWSGQPPSHFRR